MKLTSNEAKNILENFRGKTESDRWIEHCISVGNSAGKIAKALNEKGYNVNIDKTITLGYYMILANTTESLMDMR